MRAIRLPDAAEPHRLVEARRLGVVGAQSQAIERAARRRHDGCNQPAAHAVTPVRLEHVEVTHSAHPRFGGIRIPVEPAHPDYTTVNTRGEERFAGADEPRGTSRAEFAEDDSLAHCLPATRAARSRVV